MGGPAAPWADLVPVSHALHWHVGTRTTLWLTMVSPAQAVMACEHCPTSICYMGKVFVWLGD